MPSDILVPRAIERPATHARWLGLALAHHGRSREALDLVSRLQQDGRMKSDVTTAKLADRRDYALGLLVEAIACTGHPDEHDRRVAALDKAEQVMGSMTAEARELSQSRTILGWLAEERAKG